EVTKIKLLPITLETPKSTNTNYGHDFIYEPNKETVVTELLQKYVAIQIYRAHLESLAAELGARMAAMETATSNAGDMISHLTLQYNRARQAAITTELMDIVSGAEALR
ncbi:F0F1 ATP synthase subunit gamma, partial [bacterium]|nr:F0F1 ATP synthase subunit gamma [bacterium]MBU1917965.1 F0F1 ATP synthase subunit gamma [bacterium]